MSLFNTLVFPPDGATLKILNYQTEPLPDVFTHFGATGVLCPDGKRRKVSHNVDDNTADHDKRTTQSGVIYFTDEGRTRRIYGRLGARYIDGSVNSKIDLVFLPNATGKWSRLVQGPIGAARVPFQDLIIDFFVDPRKF